VVAPRTADQLNGQRQAAGIGTGRNADRRRSGRLAGSVKMKSSLVIFLCSGAGLIRPSRC